MALDIGLSHKQTLTQQQVITHQMIQSMEVLQMSSIELESYIEQLSLENPVVEITESAETPQSAKEIELQRKLDWLESTDQQNRVYYQEDRSDDDTSANWQDLKDSGEELSDYLLSQLLLADYTDKEREIVNYLIYSLDSKGYFTEDIQQTAELFGVESETIEQLLADVQELDPAGVGARSLSECLLIQLHRQKDYSEITEAVIRDHLDLVAKNHLHDIAKKLHVGNAAVVEACKEIRALNPKPGNAFSNREQLRYISPDAIVIKMEGQFEILVNEYQYPRFTISKYYEDMARTIEDAEAKKYLKEKIQQAKDVENSIQMRSSTLSKVMHVLVEKQYDFFLKGPGHKKPLRLIDIADAVDLHESTVSRTLRSKYLQCSWGVFPLNYFLTSVAVKSAVTNEEQTPEAIKEKIKEIIDNEDKKKPLSDEAISKKLADCDMKISRRTVNKYRTEMGLPDKSGRKSWE